MSQSLFSQPLNVINVGIAMFSDDLKKQHVEVTQLDWTPPGQGNMQVVQALDNIADSPLADKIAAANQQALERIIQSHPVLIGFDQAINVVPGMTPKTILHAGPPITWEKMCGAMKGAVTGALVFAAFSGSHQDAIAKGMKWREEKNLYEWTVPYLPIDPHDVGREYETDVIRINSQSGKGGIGYILEQNYGYDLPPKMREALGYAVKDVSDHLHKELNPKDVYGIFESEFLNKETPFAIPEAHYIQKDGIYAMVTVTENDITMEYTGKGNGRLDAVSNAIKKGSGRDFSVLTYKEHALETGSTSHAVAYVGLTWADGETTWGAGQHTDIMVASVKALASAINNHEWRRQSELF